MYSPVLELSSFDTFPIAQRREMIRVIVEMLIAVNRTFLRLNPTTPPMYDVAPKYAMKVRPFGLDTWEDIPRVMQLGSGDCKDFVAWRVAELREAGYDDVAPRVISFERETSQGPLVLYHVQVRIGIGVEDPSVILGMPKTMTAEQIKGLVQGPSIGVDAFARQRR